MGEKSKLIGEYGEKSVENFLKLIGWGEPPRNIEFGCNKDVHEKRTHGIDFFFSYLSPLTDGVLKRICVSVKFTDRSYPNSLSTKFKEYYDDLAQAIDCFKYSPELKELNGIKGYSSAENIGLLFWLSNEDDESGDVLSKIENIQLNSDYSFASFYVVDNKRIDFTYNSITYVKNKYQNSDITFFYPDTGKNLNPTTKKNYGKVLPIEYINSTLLPFRVEDTQSKKTSLVLCTNDGFELGDLKRLIGLSRELSKSWPGEITICFPDYNELRHSKDVRNAKKSFEDDSFTENVYVECFNDNFKTLQK